MIGNLLLNLLMTWMSKNVKENETNQQGKLFSLEVTSLICSVNVA